MTHNDNWFWLSVASNVAICLGYLFVCGALLFSRFRLVFQFKVTYLTGSLFFLTCGTHHAMNAFDLIYNTHREFAVSLLHPTMLIVDTVQALAVWFFALSAGKELADIRTLRRYLHDE